MISAAYDHSDPMLASLLIGDFGKVTDATSRQETPGYYIQKAQVLLSHGDAGKALDVLMKCNEKFAELPEWQQLDLRELTAKLFVELETILSPEEWRYRKKQMAGTGLTPTEITANNNRAPVLTTT